jgi:membrane protein DedA with SNARE-associated domain
MSLVGAIAWTTLGSVVGALALYYIGAALGRDRIRAIAAKLPLVKVADVDRTEAWFARHGGKAVFFGRMIPIFRSLISVPAGIERMRLPLFAVLTTAGSLMWNSAFVLAGYLLGANWGLVEPHADVASKGVLGLLVAALVLFVTRRIIARRRTARSTASIGSTGMHAGLAFPDTVESPTVRLATHPHPATPTRPSSLSRSAPAATPRPPSPDPAHEGPALAAHQANQGRPTHPTGRHAHRAATGPAARPAPGNLSADAPARRPGEVGGHLDEAHRGGRLGPGAGSGPGQRRPAPTGPPPRSQPGRPAGAGMDAGRSSPVRPVPPAGDGRRRARRPGQWP